MLPTKHRLTHTKDFELLFKRGKKAYAEGFGLRFGERKKKESAIRFGFVVGIKFSKHAVERNLIKRRMREVVRALTPRFVTGRDVTITAFPEAKPFSFEKIQSELTRVLAKAGLLV